MKFISKSTIHGFPKIFSANDKLVQIVYALLTITAMVLCLVMIIYIRDEYFEYEIITHTTSIKESPAIFPSIIVCKEYKNGNISDQVKHCLFKNKPIDIKKPDFDYFDDFNFLNMQ